MITQLRGILIQSLPTHAIIDVHGVGYEVLIPISTYNRLPQPQNDCTLLTHLIVREDAHQLYGFATIDERDLFRLLIHNVSGIGPRTALQILNGLSTEQFRSAVIQADSQLISKIKGIGKKTAERIIIELRDKVGISATWQASAAPQNTPADRAATDAILALVALGYKQPEAVAAVKHAQKQTPEADSEALLREALKII
jgi:Holliday junction DNA helicase RuvA